MVIPSSRKKSTLSSESTPLFFSLIDYRNNYFISDDPEKIIEFYNGFENRDQLIQWMRERPKGIAIIHEVEGDNDIIVVIPTADINGKFAKECRENIFKGLHIVFVESGEYPDPYFNYAHNCNVGIKKAMEYNPKWIVVSNDDMVKADEPSRLAENLRRLDNRSISAVFAHPLSYHSRKETVGTTNKLAFFYYARNKRSRIILTLRKRFKIKLAQAPGTLLSRIFFKDFYFIRDFIDFGVYSANIVAEYAFEIFDETFINHFEDTELSLRISLEGKQLVVSDFKIRSVIAGTQGKSFTRALRGIASLTYFSFKYDIVKN